MDYSPKIEKAAKKIAKYGFEAKFRHFNNVYDPIEGVNIEETEEFAAPVILTRPDENVLAGGVVKAGDACLLVSPTALSSEPSVGDTVVIDGTEWRIVSIDFVAPGNVKILYRVYVRRS